MTHSQHRTPERLVDPQAFGEATGEFVQVDGVWMYRIDNYDRMPPFLMSIVSDSDHWMYVSTAGGLAAGRVEAERSLFPYETDDRLHAAGGATGPFTLLRVERANGELVLWEPFTERANVAQAHRALSKSLLGNSVVFEETRVDLGLEFRYRWDLSGTYGFVRTSTLARTSDSDAVRVEMLDGLLNLMPANVPLVLQQSSSTLVEAYRRNEIDPTTSMAIYSLESHITDGAEPAESLRANIAWSTGLPGATVAVSSDRIDDFLRGQSPIHQMLTTGSRGHYLLNAMITLDDTPTSWSIVADVHQSQRSIQRRRAQLLDDSSLADHIVSDINRGSDQLKVLIAAADGDQCTADRMATAHHFANTLFNCMRGGVFVENGSVVVDDLARFLEERNRTVRRAHATWLSSLGGRIGHRELLMRVAERDDPDLERLCYEYLPLTFSRRHGDPSRPWNRFEIRVRNDDGSRILDYQGNWRDIFQNWEALCYSFPDYLESVVCTFVNASTVDGFNPYRVTRSGIDWEVPDPNDPWGNIGYWGDHQIVYLLRLLEASRSFDPQALVGLLGREVFSYADVPYRLRTYDALLRDSKDTIEFDGVRADEIEERVAIVGSDGRLVLEPDGNVLRVTLAEKLLVPALAKLANLVLDAGIWMNTQRPEWNDANNALVGNGASVVTLAYLRRYLDFCERLFADGSAVEFGVSAEVAQWLTRTLTILTAYRDRLEKTTTSNRDRKRLLDSLGRAFSEYRTTVYETGLSGRATIPTQTIIDLCRVGRDFADHTLNANRTDSGLYHSYNLIHLENEGREISVEHLPAMLEGQVAAISSGAVSPDEILAIVEALFASPLYRHDQNSFMLYPARDLPGFLDKNVLPASAVEANPLLVALMEADIADVVARDHFGTYRFAPSITSVERLREVLAPFSAEPEWSDLVIAHRSEVEDLFEEVFRHASFTGRSGSMYKYEGLGSIYWHQVSKLLLAVQEAFWRARAAEAPTATLEGLAAAYYRVRGGLSSDKTPAEYGAFPMDPYSHTPGHIGAQQPGMTGQVKEEILTRWGELGVRVTDGTLQFDPCLLRDREFLIEEREWKFHDVTGSERKIVLPPHSLGFSFCQVPIIYTLDDDRAQLSLTVEDGSTIQIEGMALDAATSEAIFRRLGTVTHIEVTVPRSLVRHP